MMMMMMMMMIYYQLIDGDAITVRIHRHTFIYLVCYGGEE
jgi:hypothetical protein